MAHPTPPAVCAFVAGPLELWVDTGASKAIEFLGYSTNGVSIEQMPFMAPVHSDESGGEQGPPIDYQLFGVQHRISAELTKFQGPVLAKLESHYNLNVSGGLAGVGMLTGCNSAKFRLLLWSPNFVRNYLAVDILEPISRSPIGSQHSRARIGFAANAPVGGVLYDDDEE